MSSLLTNQMFIFVSSEKNSGSIPHMFNSYQSAMRWGNTIFNFYIFGVVSDLNKGNGTVPIFHLPNTTAWLFSFTLVR